jgi:anti-anti-sigma regulatory factor
MFANKIIVHIPYNLDTSESAKNLNYTLGHLYNAGEKEIILDIHMISSLGGECLERIMMYQKLLKSNGGQLYVTPPRSSVENAMKTLLKSDGLKVYSP